MACELRNISNVAGAAMLTPREEGVRAAQKCNALQSGVASSEVELEAYKRALEVSAPPMWLDFASTLQDPMADRSSYTTSGLESPGLLSVVELQLLQSKVNISSRISEAPFDTPPTVIAESYGFPTLLVGDSEDPAVVQVSTWIDEGALERPVLQARRLSAWLDRLVVPQSVVSLASKWDGVPVLQAPSSDCDGAALTSTVGRLLSRLDLGDQDVVVAEQEELDERIKTLYGEKTLSLRFADLPSLLFRYSEGKFLSGDLDGGSLKHPLAVLMVLCRTTALSMTAGVSIRDQLGLLTGRAAEVSPSDAERAWEHFTSAGDIDAVVAGVVDRLAEIKT